MSLLYVECQHEYQKEGREDLPQGSGYIPERLSNNDGEKGPRHNDTFLYPRRVQQLMAIRGLVAGQRLFLTQGKEKSLSDVSQLRVGQAESSR
jgi:hypothetical protein